MPHDGQDMPVSALISGLTGLVEQAVAPAGALLATATERLRETVTVGGKISAAALEQHQRMAHGLAWLATAGWTPCEELGRLPDLDHNTQIFFSNAQAFAYQRGGG